MAYINGKDNFAIVLKGDSCFIRYSASADGTGFTEEWSEGQNYIGFATGQSAPTDKSEYEWCMLSSLVEIEPLNVRKAGTYTIKAVRESNENHTYVTVYFLDEYGERDNYTNFAMIADGALEETFTFVLESDGYGVEIESEATCTMYGFVGGGDNYYDTFWDSFQQNGQRTSYGYGFAGIGWNNSTFKPKYPIVAVGDASYMFNMCGLTDFDFVEEGVSLDFSGATTMTYFFRNANGIKRVGTIDCSKCKDLNRLFYQCGIETIDNFIVHENLGYDNTFYDAKSLVNIKVSGIIGKNGLNFKDCKLLSKASIESVINALSTTTSGLTVTLSQTAVDNIVSTEGLDWWGNLVDSRPYWKIDLA